MPTPTQLRSDVALLVNQASGDLDALWRQVDDAVQAEAVLHDVLPALIESYGSAAATVAADWYDDVREKAAIRGRFTAIPAAVEDVGAHALVGWALDDAKDLSSFQQLILGGTQRRIANYSRLTVAESAIADPQADGWQRVGNGSCAFCRMLIARGAVYSEAGADFASHDHCNCAAVPAFGGAARPVKPYTPSTRNTTDADRARVREWIATH